MEEKIQVREDGRVEYVCEHGVGHTVSAPQKYKKLAGKHWSTHGCDGCCAKTESYNVISLTTKIIDVHARLPTTTVEKIDKLKVRLDVESGAQVLTDAVALLYEVVRAHRKFLDVVIESEDKLPQLSVERILLPHPVKRFYNKK